jgi:alpha-ketoglutarate-dependent taurine dioxygenase
MTTRADVRVTRQAGALRAEVTGVDWSDEIDEIDEETVARLREAWLEHHVLCTERLPGSSPRNVATLARRLIPRRSGIFPQPPPLSCACVAEL